MRLAFLALLLANLLLLAWGQGHLGAADAGREPERLRQQIEPDKLRILAAGAAPATSAAARLCQRIEGLSAAAAETIKKSGVAEAPGWQLTLIPEKETSGHWVVIAQLPSRAVAEKKRTELRQLGVKEGQIVEDAALGPFTVSLGVFRSQALAEEFLQAVAKKGVRSAQLARRELSPDKFAVELRAPADELTRKLPEIMAPLGEASRADCAAP
ncbi:MAG: SPOR domain-containing protein [Rhodocyclaceae bacterium]|nr:SPOR domain-containing protein [Rhodocyclaceae bacterium]